MKLRILPFLAMVLLAGRAWSQANNDNFAGRLTLTGASVIAVSSLQAATHETGEPNHANYSGTQSLWWTWTAPASETVNFSASARAGTPTSGIYPGTYTRALVVYTSGALTALTEFASSGPPSVSPSIYTPTTLTTAGVSCSVQVTVETVYQIAVDGPLSLYPGDDGTVIELCRHRVARRSDAGYFPR